MAEHTSTSSGDVTGLPVIAADEDLEKKCSELVAALERSEKVRLQFRQVAEALKRKVADLEAELATLQDAQSGSLSIADLESQVVDLRERKQELEKTETFVRQCRIEAEDALLESSQEVNALRDSLETSEAALAKVREESASKEANWVVRYNVLDSRLRSSVSAELLQDNEAEIKRLDNEVSAAQEECKRLRTAVTENWNKSMTNGVGTMEPYIEASLNSSTGWNTEELERLDTMQAELENLLSVQKASTSEVRRIQHLERTNAALEEKLRVLADKHAQLKCSAVDLRDEGKNMREALTCQNEQFLKRIIDLTDERKSVKADREKLLKENVEMQSEIENLRPRVKELVGFEGLNRRLEAERQALAEEVERLRATNTALCAFVLGDDANNKKDAMKTTGSETGTAEDSIKMVLKLTKRLRERDQAHSVEQDKMLERIQDLERTNMQRNVLSFGSGGAKASATKTQPARSNSSATSWITSLGGSLLRTSTPEPPPPQGVAAQLRGGLDTMREWLP
eukprot:gnl/MRDRNA2_/MRDRNA2_104822_c0_seq1.p1 gnl/MRDRNA2_/MRDRNA2_104822_c0~~gnl/MRDRNA2_/MRDRNA2_104822_c0_seq1.p1  ORF type:complete len:513 (+),score=135.40 gnl/MRDRNA2_/MRDRNA2_104822_c0_seq1:45-1583(+)